MNSNNKHTQQELKQFLEQVADVTLPDSADLKIRQALNREIHSRKETVPTVMDMEEAAQFLKISVSALIGLLDELPSFELSGRIRFRRDQLELWMQQREKQMEWQKKRSKMNNNDNFIEFTGGSYG